MYFAFTSLSTVGFGDYHPRSDLERIVGALVLLFGVAIFSYIMGKFVEMVNQIREFRRELDDSDELNRFFGVIVQFNNNKQINLQLKRNIEDFFHFKWNNDKNQALKTSEDLAIFYQIPEWLQDNIYKQFLYKDFMQIFKKYFLF